MNVENWAQLPLICPFLRRLFQYPSTPSGVQAFVYAVRQCSFGLVLSDFIFEGKIQSLQSVVCKCSRTSEQLSVHNQVLTNEWVFRIGRAHWLTTRYSRAISENWKDNLIRLLFKSNMNETDGYPLSETAAYKAEYQRSAHKLANKLPKKVQNGILSFIQLRIL